MEREIRRMDREIRSEREGRGDRGRVRVCARKRV